MPPPSPHLHTHVRSLKAQNSTVTTKSPPIHVSRSAARLKKREQTVSKGWEH